MTAVPARPVPGDGVDRPDASAVVGARALPLGARRFLATEAAGGLALVAAAIVALVWANSPWHASYEDLWHAEVNLTIGGHGVTEDLRHLVNDGLMALFFLVVGLEVKRELVAGDLRDRRVAALPVLAALGGMVVPAGLYLALNAGTDAAAGWGIPMATDIAFALAVLALLGPRVPAPLKLFLLTLAIVDDIGAIVVIAVAYTDHLDAAALAVAAGFVLAAVACVRARVWSPAVYVALGVGCWLATYHSGVHATLAGVAFGLLAPARPLAPGDVAREWAEELSDEPTAAEMRSLTAVATETVSVAERVQHRLHPYTSFLVVPVFALANAGVRISGDEFSAPGTVRVALGVVVGLVVGKAVGITAATILAVRLRLASLPEGVTWAQMVGVAAVAGVGFTVSLFVGGLAFDRPALQDAAGIGILLASVTAAVVGAGVLLVALRERRDPDSV
jgi:NhaA family Na+:H+ antiporter